MLCNIVRLMLLTVVVFVPQIAAGRQWTDVTGKFKIEAELLTIKKGTAYLEKPDGDVVQVPLDKLCKDDLTYLVGLSAYSDYFAANPIPGSDTSSVMVTIKVENDSQVGEIRRFPELGWGVRSLAFSPNGAFLAVGKMDRALFVFDVNKEKQVSSHEKLDGLDQVTALAFTPDGDSLLSGGYRGRIQVWEVSRKGQLLETKRFVGHSEEVNAIAVSSDGQYVLSGGKEKKVRYWKLGNAREEFAIDGFRGAVKAAYITPSGKQGLASDGEVLMLIDLGQGTVLQTMQLGNSHVAQTVAIAPDGSRVIVQDSYALRMWGIRDGREYPPLQDREIQWSCVFSPDAKYVISGGRGKINLWEVETSRKVYEFDTAGTSYAKNLAYSPDRRHIAGISDSAGQSLQVFRLPAEFAQ